MNQLLPENLDNAACKKVLMSYKKAICFLQDSPKVLKYIKSKKTLKEEFGEIFLLRLQLSWFDCALDILQDTEIFHSKEVQEKAFYFLNNYYRPQKQYISGSDYWKWLADQNIPLLNNLLAKYPDGDILFLPATQASATSIYQMGNTYSEIYLNMPVNYDIEGTIHSSPFNLNISFRWTKEKMWGEIDLFLQRERKILREEKQFLTFFRIDLKKSDEYIEKNLIINTYGKFFISKNKDRMYLIQNYLDEKKISCILKIGS